MGKFGIGKALALGIAAPVAAYGLFNTTMHVINECYSKKVWQTPEECDAVMPGDDLVVDPNGYPTYTVSQAMDLNASADEVWKHVYQMDITKAGYYSFMWAERLFGMNVNNCYNLEEQWQGEDAKKPGDMWCWGFMGYGAEVCDLVPGKYIVWANDSRRPPKAPGATSILLPGMDYLIWNWTIALKPLDDGKRCRIFSRYTLAWGPHNAYTNNILRLVVGEGGGMMTRRMFENMERAARYERPKSLPMKLWERFMGRSHAAPDDLHEATSYPEVRWSRDFPWIEGVRAPITDDPNWPPAAPADYVPPIAENNEKKGWTPEIAIENEKKAQDKYEELRRRIAALRANA